MKRAFKYLGISLLVAVLSLPLWAQMVVPTVPAGGGAGAFNPSGLSGLYCLLTGCTITPGPLVVDGEFEVNNALISACGSGGGACSAGPAFNDRVGINTSTPATVLDVNGSVTIGSLFTVFDAVNNTIGINITPGTDSTIPLLIRGGIQINNTATACTALQEGSLQSDLSGSLKYCNGDNWITFVSLEQNSGLTPYVDLVFESVNLECNGAFGDCVDGDEVNEIQDTGTGNLGTCAKETAGPGMIYRSPCALGGITSRIQAGGNDCVEFEFNRVASFFHCAAPFPLGLTRYSACAVIVPYTQSDAKGAGALNLCGLGPNAGGECGWYQADDRFGLSITGGGGVSTMGSDEFLNILDPQLGSPLSISCYTVMDTTGGGPSGIFARAGGWRGDPGWQINGPGPFGATVQNLKIGGAGLGAAGTQYLFRGRILAFYFFDSVLLANQLESLQNFLQLKFRSYY